MFPYPTTLANQLAAKIELGLGSSAVAFGPLAFFAKKKPEVDVSAHIDLSTQLLWILFGLIVTFFVVRPELWRALWFRKVDPRPAALYRIAFGLVVIWTFADLLVLCGEFLFTDQGLWLTDLARKKYGGQLKTLWDPEAGFEHWYDIFKALWGKFSLLHMRSDPPFTYSVFAALFVSAFCMTIGLFTRPATIITWFLVNTLYNYSPIYYTGGDTVLRTMMFMTIFIRTGEAYSVDSYLRRRRILLGKDAAEYPEYRKIPWWPMVIMMMQSSIIYFSTGILKSGATWNTEFTATYYAFQLDHFYRFPLTGFNTWLQMVGILPMGTFVVHWWEMLFPMAMVGMGLRGFEKDLRRGQWVTAAAWRRWLGWALLWGAFLCAAYLVKLACLYYLPKTWTVGVTKESIGWMAFAAVAVLPPALVSLTWYLRGHQPRMYQFVLSWVLGKRTFLLVGLGFHLGTDVFLNVGTFPQATVAPYLVWLSGAEVFAMWKFLLWRAAAKGEAGRPEAGTSKLEVLLSRLRTPIERMKYRVRVPRGVVKVPSDDASVRRAALLRGFDVGESFDYDVVEASSPAFALELPDGRVVYGDAAGRVLIPACPALWILWPIKFLPGVGAFALRIVGQRVP